MSLCRAHSSSAFLLDFYLNLINWLIMPPGRAGVGERLNAVRSLDNSLQRLNLVNNFDWRNQRNRKEANHVNSCICLSKTFQNCWKGSQVLSAQFDFIKFIKIESTKILYAAVRNSESEPNATFTLIL